MNNLFKNSFDAKYVELAKMLIHKKCNPPEVKYSPTFKINGIIHKIIIDLHGKGKVYEQYTYNSTNKVAKLIHYHKRYDYNTNLLMRKRSKLHKKRPKTKEEEEMEKKCLKCIKDCNKFLEMLKKKTI